MDASVARVSAIAGPYALPILALFGAASILSCTYKLVNAVYSIFLARGTNLRKYGPEGSWAVITGASDGIGKEFSLQLAARGFNTLLISRTASKLSALASEITTAHPSRATQTLAIDFSTASDGDYARLSSAIHDLDVAILVNNVGRSHDIPVSFLDTPPAELHDIIEINVTGTLRVTQAVVPGMVARRRGLVLTMGSFGGFVPTPLLATYSGSKAFLNHWSTALKAELAPAGVDVQLAVAYLVTSAMSKVRRSNWMIPTPRQWVRACLGKLGVRGTAAGREGTIAPFWSHALMYWAVQELLGVWSALVLGQNRKMHADIRRRALRKREREAAAGKKET